MVIVHFPPRRSAVSGPNWSNWCSCDVPAFREGISKLHKTTRCLTCKRRIRKFFSTQSGRLLVLRIANELHDCQGCGKWIEPGALYFSMSVTGDWYEGFHIWALCYPCGMGIDRC